MRSLVSLIFLFASLLLAVLPSQAQPWHVQFEGDPGVALMHPAGGTNALGRMVFACGEGIGDRIVVLFQIDAQGQVIWSLDDQVRYTVPQFDQTPVQVEPLPNGGWAVLVEQDIWQYPMTRPRLVWLAFSSHGVLNHATVACDSLFTTGACYSQMVISDSTAFIAFARGVVAQYEIRFQRIALIDGQIQEGSYGRAIIRGYKLDLAARGDSCFIAAADSLFVYGFDGVQRHAWGGAYFLDVKMLLADSSCYLFGYHTPNGSALLERFSSNGLFSTDTISYGQVGPVDLAMTINQDTLFLGYGRSYNLFCRRYSNGFLSPEDTLSYQNGTAVNLSLASFDSDAVGAVWCDIDTSHNVFIQQWRNGSWRWPQGLVVGAMGNMSALPPLFLTGNRQVAAVGWIDQGILHVQPPDTGSASVVQPRPIADAHTIIQIYPNPFNSTTVLQFAVPRTSRVMIRAYDVLGREVDTIADAVYSTGEYSISWHCPDCASGVYWIRMSGDGFQHVRKTILLR
jgi:hypothetical protein